MHGVGRKNEKHRGIGSNPCKIFNSLLGIAYFNGNQLGAFCESWIFDIIINKVVYEDFPQFGILADSAL